MPVGAGFLRRVLIVVGVAVLALGLAGKPEAEASVSAAAQTRSSVHPATSHAAALAARRALVRRDTSVAREQALNRMMEARRKGKGKELPLAKLRALAARERAQALEQSGTFPGVRRPPLFAAPSATQAPAAAVSADSGVIANLTMTGPEGIVSGGNDANFPNNPEGDVFAGEALAATADVWNDNISGASEQVQVTWTEICGALGQSSTVGSETVTAPSYDGPGVVDPAVVTVSFNATSTCPLYYPVPNSDFTLMLTATPIGASSGEETIEAYWYSSLPASQIMACPGSPDSAGIVPPIAGVCADPVDSSTGAFADTFTDATLKSPGFPLSVTRSYSSANAASGALGPGWSLPWEAHLSVDSTTGNATFTAENGDVYLYASDGAGGFTAPFGARSALAEVTDSSGNVTGYTLTAPDNHVLQFNASGQLTSEVDATGRGLTLAYNSSGQVASITDAAGQVLDLSYSGGLLMQATLPGGHTIGYGYTGGLLTSVTDPDGDITKYAYNSAGLLASIQDPGGNDTARNTYNTSGQVTSQEDGAGNTTTFSYTTTSGGLPETDVTDPNGGISSFAYGGGVVLESVDPLNGTTEYSDNEFIQPVQITDPLGNSTTMAYDTSGNLLEETDPLGNEQQWSYDSSNNLLTYTDANGNTTTYTYNSMDEVLSATSPLGEETTYTFDSSGNLVSSVDPRGNASGATASGYTTTYAYDSVGQLTSVTNPDADKTSYTHDVEGYPLTVTDPENHVTTYAYDADERLTGATAPDGGVTKYAYDGAGNLTSRTDPDANTSTFAYDADNRMVKSTDPLGNSVTYAYDGDANQVTFTDARGITTATSYDADNRPVKITYSDGTPTVTYAYDTDGNTTTVTDGTGTRTMSYDADGELTAADGPSSAGFSYAYDADGNITSRTYPDGTSASYSYDSDSQASSITVGSATTSYSYDAAGDLTSTTNPNGVTETRTYDGSGLLTGISNATSSSTLDSYALTLNADGRPSQAAITQDSAAQPTWYYTYDSADQLASACSTSSAASACSTASGGGETAWTYDDAGNTLTRTTGGSTTDYSYNAADELTKAVTGSATSSYAYDADGNQTAAGSDTYAYNGAGELSKAVTAAGTDTYGYDSGGNLTTTDVGGSLSRSTIWDLNNPLPRAAEEISSSGSTTADYLYGPGGDLASMTTPAGSYYATTDWLGSVTGLVNSSGTQVTSTTYTPYGTPSTTDLVSGAPSSSIGYAGSYSMPGADGLDDMRARDYSPASGAFTAVDPMLSVTGQPYAYVGGDPVAVTDPAGTITCPSWIPGCGVATNIQHAVSSWWRQVNTCGNSSGIFVTTPRGVTYKIPQGWTMRVADNGKGIVYQRPGATGNADMIRIMEPTARYPNGYAVVYNSQGQPVDNLGSPGNTLGRQATHLPEDQLGEFPELPLP